MQIWLEIKPVNSKVNQFWIFIERTDAEFEAPILWPPDVKSCLRKDSDAGKDWREEKGMTQDEMVGWHHCLNGHKFEQAPGDGEGQESLACCSLWGRKESGMTEWLNNKNIMIIVKAIGLNSLVYYLKSDTKRWMHLRGSNLITGWHRQWKHLDQRKKC